MSTDDPASRRESSRIGSTIGHDVEGQELGKRMVLLGDWVLGKRKGYEYPEYICVCVCMLYAFGTCASRLASKRVNRGMEFEEREQQDEEDEVEGTGTWISRGRVGGDVTRRYPGEKKIHSICPRTSGTS
ncbi:hypothetical protein M0802_008699 [Mischocyttarus mexicanus]|nr:hypothetical protein M0802_008699 [Mischocyttarus mexicanus]